MRVLRLVSGEYLPEFYAPELRRARFKSEPLDGNFSSPGSARIRGPGYEAKLVNGKVWEATYRTNGWTPTKFTSFSEYADAGGPDWKGPTLAPNPKAPSTTPANLKKAAALADSGGKSDGESFSGGGGESGASDVGAEEVDPFAIAMMAAEFNSAMQPEVLARSTEQGFALANRGTENNISAFLSAIDRIAPGYGKLLRQMETEASDFMAGRLPQEAKDLLYRESAERGVARGVFGQRAQYEGLTSIRDKQLQVMELGFNQAAALRAESDRVAQSLIINPVTTTLDLYSRSLPLFTIAVGEALNVETANADRATQASIAEGQLALGYANLALNREKFEYDKQKAEAQRKAAERNALFSLVGTGLGAAGGFLAGGPPGAVIGAQLGGALGSAAAGNYTGAQASLGQAIGTTYGQYSTNSGIFAPTSPPPGTTLPSRAPAPTPSLGGGTLAPSVIGGSAAPGSALGGYNARQGTTLTFRGY